MTAFGLDLKFAAEALWKVLVAGLILGAGLPAVFAVGIRGLAMAGDSGNVEEGQVGSRPNPLGNVLAGVMFLIVAYGIVAGLLFIIASGQGKELSFDHIIPWIEPKS